MYKEFWIISEWCSHRLVISIWVWSWLENLNSVKLTMKLSGCSYCSCCKNLDWVWICRESLKFEYEVVAKGCIKHEVVAKAWIMHKYMSRKPICHKINVAFGYEKNIPAQRAGKKIILLRFCPKKISRPRQKFQAPPWISNGPCLRESHNFPQRVRKYHPVNM